MCLYIRCISFINKIRQNQISERLINIFEHTLLASIPQARQSRQHRNLFPPSFLAKSEMKNTINFFIFIWSRYSVMRHYNFKCNVYKVTVLILKRQGSLLRSENNTYGSQLRNIPAEVFCHVHHLVDDTVHLICV